MRPSLLLKAMLVVGTFLGGGIELDTESNLFETWRLFLGEANLMPLSQKTKNSSLRTPITPKIHSPLYPTVPLE